jgi:hypothetical protein
VRAEWRCGVLLKELLREPGKRTDLVPLPDKVGVSGAETQARSPDVTSFPELTDAEKEKITRTLERLRLGEITREKSNRIIAAIDPHWQERFAARLAAQKSPYAQALDEAGLSRQRAHRMEGLANVPDEEFEAALADPVVKPTVGGLLERARTAPPQPQIDRTALWFWGRLLDFEREGILDSPLEVLLVTMTAPMREDVLRLLPVMLAFFKRLKEESHEYS